MEFSLDAKAFKEELRYNHINAEVISSGTMLETKASFCHSFGNVGYKEVQLETGTILMGDYQIKEDLVLSNEISNPAIEMHFNLGHAIKVTERNRPAIDVYGMHHNLIGIRDARGTVEFKRNKSYKTFDVHLPVAYITRWYGQNQLLDQFIEHFQKDNATTLYQHAMHITPEMHQIIAQINNCPFSGFTRRLYLETKIQELFVLQLHLGDQLISTGILPKKKLSPREVAQLNEARIYIENNLNNTLTITDLAHRVGTNESKLKRGFKILFGSTVFAYMQQKKMEKARIMVIEEGKSIGEVASFVGYMNLSNFSNAFKSYHGFSPLKLKGTKEI